VLLLAPNLLGYIRLLLLMMGWALASTQQPWAALILFALNLALDGVDGALARAVNQVSMPVVVS
jgi:phosphatidylglycerophosphate synthase